MDYQNRNNCICRTQKFLKVTIILLITLTIIISFTTDIIANQKPVVVAVDGIIINPGDQPPFINQNRVLVPLRVITDHLGAKTTYNSLYKTAFIQMGNTVVELMEGSTIVKVNGNLIRIDAAPLLTGNGRLVVPLRFIGEVFGYRIGWDEANNVANIFTDKQSVYEKAALMLKMPGIIAKRDDSTRLELIKIGDQDHQVRFIMGTPIRIEKGFKGLEFWTYHYNYHDYYLFGFDDGELVFIYTNAPEESFLGVEMGSSRSLLEQSIQTKSLPPLRFNNDQILLHLYDNHPRSDKIYTVDGDNFILYYLDEIDNRISGINIMHKNLLVKGNPVVDYTLTYFGRKPNFGYKEPRLSDLQEIERSYERQIFDLTNAIRVNREMGTVDWHEDAADVAYEHSKDMYENKYFDHISLDGKGPGDRLKAAKIYFQEARENIALNQLNSVDAVHAWMNSEAHREAILHEPNTHLGVGVYLRDEIYYTQEFMVKN